MMDNETLYLSMFVFNITGSVLMIDNQRKMRYDVSCDIESQFFTTSVSGNIDHTKGQSLSSRIELKYAIGGGREESFVLNNKLKDQSTNTLTQYDLNRLENLYIYII